MRNIFLMCILLLFVTMMVAQTDNASLTEEFPNLSAKQRAQIAKKEARDATNDIVFQSLMSDADSLFQLGQYNASINTYKQARQRRPYNVHPKVKIQDLQDLIDQEERMNGELATLEEETPIISSDLNSPPAGSQIPKTTMADPAPTTQDSVQVKADEVHITPLPSTTGALPEGSNEQPLKKQVVQKEPKPVSVALSEPSVFDIPIAEDGVNKEVYREANAVITQLTVVKNGRTDVYKKVYHQWGYVFYFKNGSAITERMWADETLTFY